MSIRSLSGKSSVPSRRYPFVLLSRSSVSIQLMSRVHALIPSITRAGASLAVGIAIAGGMAVAGSGIASAAQVGCVSPPSANDIRVIGDASCGATATVGNAGATAMDSGTAVSVANGGSANSVATGFGVALSSSRDAGAAHAYAIGGGISHSNASNGHTTISVAGWGSGATAEASGVKCVGTLSFAVNLNTGAVCAMR
jgi:hypothetical protein